MLGLLVVVVDDDGSSIIGDCGSSTTPKWCGSAHGDDFEVLQDGLSFFVGSWQRRVQRVDFVADVIQGGNIVGLFVTALMCVSPCAVW